MPEPACVPEPDFFRRILVIQLHFILNSRARARIETELFLYVQLLITPERTEVKIPQRDCYTGESIRERREVYAFFSFPSSLTTRSALGLERPRSFINACTPPSSKAATSACLGFWACACDLGSWACFAVFWASNSSSILLISALAAFQCWKT